MGRQLTESMGMAQRSELLFFFVTPALEKRITKTSLNGNMGVFFSFKIFITG